MKKIIAILAILAIFSSIGLYAQDWTTVTSGTTERLNKIHFINDTTGFIIGENGTILRTTNGGTTWSTINSGVSHNLHTISFEDSNVGYINGLKTTDGGATWNIQNTTTSYFMIKVISPGHIVAGLDVTFSGEIFKSTDGGINWNSVGDPVISAFYTDAFFINSTTGYLTSWYGGHLVKTTDMGSSWTEITSLSQPLIDDLYGVSFPADNLGIVVSSNNEILKTTDEAVTWTSIYPSNGSTWFQPQGLFTNSTQNYIVVGINGQSNNNEKIYVTTDGGINWTLTNASTNDLYDVYCTSNNCYAVGNNGTIVTGSDPILNVTNIDTDLQELSIYPNPVENEIRINSTNEFLTFEVYNILGQNIIPKKEILNKTISVSQLKEGVFFLKIQTNDNRSKTIKFIKK